jgi:hypothetical protein
MEVRGKTDNKIKYKDWKEFLNNIQEISRRPKRRLSL